ncbi:MAG: hypothetical protein EOO14_00360 [Chitinophagaceae bacterium]|nr:MAG: hypothetical protein EOO14_00360 [Chitinophagaceae bacterium]
MITIFLFALAGFFKSVADTLQHHFGVSVFKNLDARWWNPAISWEYTGFLPLTKYRADAWHLANSGMITCFAIGAACMKPVALWGLHVTGGYLVILYGLGFIGTFNLFYNKILKQ